LRPSFLSVAVTTREEEAPGEEEIRDGFYITFYLFGYGDDEESARQNWVTGLKLVRNAIRQLSAK